MQMIRHRINQISELTSVDRQHGVEIDLRSEQSFLGKIHLAHDPWKLGDPFESWLNIYKELQINGPLLLNTKEDGLEYTLLQLLKKFEITNFFFLDTVAPTLVRLVSDGLGSHCMARISEYEPLEGILTFKNKIHWAWLDCFQGVPLPLNQVKTLQKQFQICLVSPELHQKRIERIGEFREVAPLCQAICTKQPAEWEKILKGF